MIADIYTIIRHEWKGYFRYADSRRSGWLRWSALGILGTIITRALGPAFGTSWATVPAIAFITVIFIPAIVADSFAGERERETLETLLASRISDTALLIGKYLANILYGMVAAVVMVGLGIVVTLLSYGGGTALEIQPVILGAAMVIALLAAGAMTGVGILVSLRAPTIRRATESITIIILVLTMIPLVLAELPTPDWLWSLLQAISTTGADPGVREFAFSALILLTLNLILISIALARFRRSELIS